MHIDMHRKFGRLFRFLCRVESVEKVCQFFVTPLALLYRALFSVDLCAIYIRRRHDTVAETRSKARVSRGTKDCLVVVGCVCVLSIV